MNKIYISIIIIFSLCLFSLTLFIFAFSIKRGDSNIQSKDIVEVSSVEHEMQAKKTRQIIKNEELPTL